MNILLAILISFATATNASTAGHGGGDNITRPDHFMWFVGDAEGKNVTYCITLGGKTSNVSERIANATDMTVRIQNAVDYAFATWKKYRYSRPPQNNRMFVNLIPQHVGNCRNQTSDLKILMGALPQDELFGPESAYRKQYQNPAAYARLESYDFKKGWGQGVIWLHDGSPFQYISADGEIAELDFQRDGVVEALIMHEMGHVFGNGHISGTIMDENFIDTIATGLDPAFEKTIAMHRLLAIDKSIQLLPIATIEDSSNPIGIPVTIDPVNFEKRFGQTSNANIVASVTWPSNPYKSMTLNVATSNKEFHVEIVPLKTKLFSDNNNAFNYCLNFSGKDEICCGIKRYSFMQLSNIIWPSGLEEQVFINHNIPDQSVRSGMWSLPITAGYLREKKREYIFDIEPVGKWPIDERKLVQSIYAP